MSQGKLKVRENGAQVKLYKREKKRVSLDLGDMNEPEDGLGDHNEPPYEDEPKAA